MFNDLQANQSAPTTPSVDDIFAETDKPVTEAKSFSGYYNQSPANSVSSPAPTEIETQKAGLSASDGAASPSKSKILKIGLIILFIILLASLGYLVYIKFIANQAPAEVIETKTTAVVTTNQEAVVTVTEPVEPVIPVSQEITVVTSTPLATTTPPVSNLVDTDGDGLTDEEENVLGTNVIMTDTDGDGLSDADEVKIYNTNPGKVDTDDDTLPDYDEVKIYRTDPNKIDTDGDSYDDGSEVKGGYNPLGTGKLIDAVN